MFWLFIKKYKWWFAGVVGLLILLVIGVIWHAAYAAGGAAVAAAVATEMLRKQRKKLKQASEETAKEEQDKAKLDAQVAVDEKEHAEKVKEIKEQVKKDIQDTNHSMTWEEIHTAAEEDDKFFKTINGGDDASK